MGKVDVREMDTSWRPKASHCGLACEILLGITMVFCVLSSLSPCTSGLERQGKKGPNSKAIAGHRVIRVFNEANSPIRRSFPGFRPGKIFQDHSGRYWIAPSLASERMVVAYEETTDQWEIFSEERNGHTVSLHYNSGALIPFSVNKIAESKDGQIWFADSSVRQRRTHKPFLSSFNGKQWQRYQADKAIADDVNIGLFTDAAGTLWFWAGDELRGYDGQKWFATKRVSDSFREPAPTEDTHLDPRKIVEPAKWNKKVRYEILDAIQDREGNLWLGMLSGVVRYQKQRDEWRRFSQIEQNEHIYEDKIGRLWFADWDYVSLYDKAKDSINTFRLSDHFSVDRCSDSFPGLNCLVQDRRGQVFFGHGCGLLCYAEASGRWDLISLTDIGLDNEVEDIIEDRTGRIWISTSGGLAVLEP